MDLGRSDGGGGGFGGGLGGGEGGEGFGGRCAFTPLIKWKLREKGWTFRHLLN